MSFVYPGVILNSVLLAVAFLQVTGKLTDQNEHPPEEFDFIIVGGGTAGCAIASRLSESRQNSVLILEAGQLPHAGLDVPGLISETLPASGDGKVYQSKPQENAALLNGGVVSYLVGRTLGGTSSINTMMFNRGSPYDYDNWAEITKDPSWKYANLMKYFKNIEDYHGDFPSEEHHGTGGPITVSRPRYAPGQEAWLEAGQYLGYHVGDSNGPQRVGFSRTEFSKRFGRRVSSFTGYIKRYLGSRPNLKVTIDAVVQRVLFHGNIAQGVVYSKKGEPGQIFARARREVILSAGVIGSPEILLKSGIGPEKLLTSVGVPLVKNLPVGSNFQDHYGVPLTFIINNRSLAFIPDRDLNPQSLAFYNRFGDGPYSYHLIHSQAFLASSVATKMSYNNGSWADFCLFSSAQYFGGDDISTLETGLGAPITGPSEAVVSLSIAVTRPKSRGRVRLNSTNPLDADPILDFQYFTHPDDLQAVVEGIYTALTLFEQTPSYRQLGARYPTTPLKPCQHLPFRSEKYWRCYVRQVSYSILHGAGTCKMGRGEEDPTAVVDSQLRVIGMKNLRVVDTSIMPDITNANTHVPAYVIAEKTADLILRELRI